MLIRLTKYLILLLVLLFYNNDSFSQDNKIENDESRKYFISTGISVPLTGSLYFAWGGGLTDKIVLSNYIAYFNRKWMLLLDQGDWVSQSGYLGLMIQYFPFSRKNDYTGYYIGADVGIATSYQTYKPLNKSDIFFFGYIELWLLCYRISLYDRLKLDICSGGGYAPVSKEVKIEGHVNEGDYYPLVDIRLVYRW